MAHGGQRHPKCVQVGPEEQRKGEGSVLGEEGGSLSYTRMRVCSQGGTKMKGQTLPGTDASLAPLLNSYVNLGKADIFIETQFPLLSMEIVTAPSAIQGCWQGQRGEWI